MKKNIPNIKIPHIIALAAITGLLAIAGNSVHAQTADDLDQTVFPTITAQPVDQVVPIGSDVVLSVQANNADGYQWLINGIPADGQTNNSLTIANAGIGDVGLYSCEVFNGDQAVPTRAASVEVETTAGATVASTTASTPTAKATAGSALTASAMTAGASGACLPGGGPIIVFGAPISGGGKQGTCPGTYAGYVNYTKSISQGWGWVPSTNTTIFTASDGSGRTDTKIMYGGKYGDTGCNQTTVTIPNPPPSPSYRFTIFFPNNVPTTNYPIVLTGFNTNSP
jgi:hypothetical protein